jgi:hypothetical protein
MAQENKVAGTYSIEALSEFLTGFNSFKLSACLSLLSGVIESAFRAFHKAVFPSQYNIRIKQPFTFECIYKNLLPTLGLSDYLELLKLLRLLRNSLAHNNGFHTRNDDCASWEDVSGI